MPRIPTRKGGPAPQRAPLDPRISADGSGLESQAISRVAGQVSQFALNLMQKRKTANDASFAQNKYLQDLKDFNQFEKNLKLEEGDNPQAYAQKVQEWSDKRQQSVLKNAPNSDAANMYANRSSQFFTRAQIDADNYQNTKRAEFYFSSTQSQLEDLANGFVDNPDAVAARDLQITLEQDMETDKSVLGETVAKKALVDRKNLIAESVVSGLVRQERYGEAMAVLENNEAEGKITNEIEPKRKAALMAQVSRLQQSKAKEYNGELRRQVRDTFSGATVGLFDPKQITSLKAQVQAMPSKPGERKRLLTTLDVAEKLAPQFDEMRQIPASEWKSADELLKSYPKNLNQSEVNRARVVLMNAQSKDKKLRESDGAQYVLQNFPNVVHQEEQLDLEALVDKSIHHQEDLGIRNIRPLPVERAKFLAATIEEGNSDDATQALNYISEKGGRHAGAILSQMVKDGRMKDDYLLVAGLPNPVSQARVIDNIKREKEFDEIIKGNPNASGLKASVAQNETYMQMSEGLMRANDASRSSFVSGIKNQITIEAKRNVANGEDSSTAVEKAVQKVYSENYFQTESEVPTIVPRFIPKGKGEYFSVDSEIVEDFVASHQKASYFKSLNLTPGSEFRNAFDDLSDSEVKERFYSQLEEQAFWDLSSDQKSLILKSRSSSPSGDIVAVRDNDRQLIRVDIIDMHENPDDLLVDERKGMLTRIGEFFETGEATADE